MVHEQFESLQAFWPALQVLAGDVEEAIETHDAFFSLWTQFGFLPESYLLASRTVHPSMKYYPLRPELAESTYALYRATRDPYYLQQGAQMLKSLNGAARVPGGFASVKDVKNPRVLEDRMASFFLAETCKYLFLLFDEANFVHADPSRSLIFNTEGHLIPVQRVLRTSDGDRNRSDDTGKNASLWEKAAQAVAGAADAIKAAVPRPEKRSASSRKAGRADPRSCPNIGNLEQLTAHSFVGDRESWLPPQRQHKKTTPATSPATTNNVCAAQGSKQSKKQQQNTNMLQLQGVEVQAGDGFFKVREEQGEAMVFRVMPNLGVEMSHSDSTSAHFYLFRPKEGRDTGVADKTVKTSAVHKILTDTGNTAIDMTVTGFYVRLTSELSSSEATTLHSFPASNAMFGPRKTSLIGSADPKVDAVPVVLASPIDGCTSQTLKSSETSARSASDASVTGSVVVVERGSCAFVSKVYAAQKSGASGVIVVNSQRAELFMMGGDGTPRQGQIRIPSVMVSAASGAAIRSIVRQSAAKGNQMFVSFGEHQFELTAPDEKQLKSASGSSLSVFAGGDSVAPGLGLRPPIAWGSCTDFSFHGMSDWGIHVSRLTDGNYQLMLVGQRVCCLPRPSTSVRPPYESMFTDCRDCLFSDIAYSLMGWARRRARPLHPHQRPALLSRRHRRHRLQKVGPQRSSKLAWLVRLAGFQIVGLGRTNVTQMLTVAWTKSVARGVAAGTVSVRHDRRLRLVASRCGSPSLNQ